MSVADFELLAPGDSPVLASSVTWVSFMIFVTVKSLLITVTKRTVYLYMMGTRERQTSVSFASVVLTVL